MKHKLKYINLFEDLSQDKEFLDFLDKIEFAYWEDLPKQDAFEESYIQSDKTYILTYRLHYYDGDEISDDGYIKIENIPDLVKWSDTPFGKYKTIWGEDLYSFDVTVSKNPNLIELDRFQFDVTSEDNTSIYIEISDNPKLKYIDFVNEYWEISDNEIKLDNNPELIRIDNLPEYIHLSVYNCPKLTLSYILYLLTDDDTDELKFEEDNSGLIYDNNNISFETSSGDIDITEAKKLATEEIHNIQTFRDAGYIETIPGMLYFLDFDDSVVAHIFKNLSEDLIPNLISKHPEYEQYVHLHHPKYSNTGAKSVAKVATGVTYGLF